MEDEEGLILAGDPQGPTETYLQAMKNLEEKLKKLKEQRDKQKNDV